MQTPPAKKQSLRNAVVALQGDLFRDALGTNDVSGKHIHFRDRAGQVTPYIRTRCPLHGTNVIEEVLVGPSATETSEHGVKLLLQKYQIEARVIRSTVPYVGY